VPYHKEMKVIRLLQDKAQAVEQQHGVIGRDIEALKRDLMALHGARDVQVTPEFTQRREEILQAMERDVPLRLFPLEDIYSEAEAQFAGRVRIRDLLSQKDLAETELRISGYVTDFNRRYGLDGWDYAIAIGCGVLAGLLDCLCVQAPLKQTAGFNQKVDGLFNGWVQDAFNAVLPPGTSKLLSDAYKVASADVSVGSRFVDGENLTKPLSPTNHRFRALSHDPLLGILIGAWDMLRGTCTIVYQGEIRSLPTKAAKVDMSPFRAMGQMLGHLLSDVNAPSAKGNRGMGLPAPLMGLFRMFSGVNIGDSTLDKQVEWMYVKGYDFRHFTVTSIPSMIMELCTRLFYTIKQMTVHGQPLGQSMIDTVPARMNPRFRILLAMAYGAYAAINGGRVYLTGNLLNLNYSAWMGLAWNGFHALRWALCDRHLKLWAEVSEREFALLQDTVMKIDLLEAKACKLAIG